jgi:sentrin-specific protease 1
MDNLERCRQEGEWLDSSIIDAYLEKIVSEQSGLEYIPNYIIDMYIANKEAHIEEISNWIRHISNWTQIELLFVPVFLAPNHWAMAVYKPKEQEFFMFDSKIDLGREKQKMEFMSEITNLFADICQIHGQQFDEDVHLMEEGKNVPQQGNESDCGVFALMFAYYIGKEMQIPDTFNYCNMDARAFREKIYQEISSTKL